MNTLSRAVSAHLFPDVENYKALRSGWRALTNAENKPKLKAGHYLLYLALQGKDWRKAFGPIINRRKLDNGAFLSWGLFRANWMLHDPRQEAALLAPFGGLVTPEMLAFVRSVVPWLNPYKLDAEEISTGKFGFEAYGLPENLVIPTAEKVGQ